MQFYQVNILPHTTEVCSGDYRYTSPSSKIFVNEPEVHCEPANVRKGKMSRKIKFEEILFFIIFPTEYTLNMLTKQI